MAFEKKKYSLEIGGKTLTIELSRFAEQANASVMARYGETAALVTVVMGDTDSTASYFPLRVDYEERFYASGKIIGSRFIRREGRPSEDAVLSGRLVDRVIRPLFDHSMRRDVQVVVTVMAFDEENDPDFVGLVGASTALAISDVPWGGPVGGVRVSKANGGTVVNPNNSVLRANGAQLELFAAGPEGEINMVEFGGDEVAEAEVLECLTVAQKEIDRIVAFQQSIVKEAGKEKASVARFAADEELKSAVTQFLEGKLEEAVYAPTKKEQSEKLTELKEALVTHVEAIHDDVDPKVVRTLLEKAIDALIHADILERDRRPDGRRLDEVRSLEGEVKLFERTHGSALFARGTTQALAVATLAPPGQEQLIETMEETRKRRFILHYNFPPYSVGEIGPFRSPGRREIGHGALAEKALRPLIPTQEQFPYTIRVVSEILSSNGSSSMATVCAGTLALMDAGVPLKRPAAGIAMGLVLGDAGRYKILTDIQGPEDHSGDMDFKVAGTTEGITAIQLDVKVRGLTLPIIEETLAQAKKARLEMLSFLSTVLKEPRAELSPHAPTVSALTIDPEKIGFVIGSGGKVINGLIKKFGLAGIDIEDDGRVFVSGTDKKNVQAAVDEIEFMTRELKVGDIAEGTVVKLLDFGAIVDLGGGLSGMIHVSELTNGFVKKVNDVVKMGDRVRVKVIRVGDDGHIGLSIKQLAELGKPPRPQKGEKHSG